MGAFLKKAQTTEEYYEKIMPNDSYFRPTEEVQLPNVCHIAVTNEVKYNNNNNRLVVDAYYAVQGWTDEDPENPENSKELYFLGDAFSSDDDDMNICQGGIVPIKDYIEKIEYAVRNGSSGEYVEDFYNATVEIINPGEGNEDNIHVRFHLKKPVVSQALFGLFSFNGNICRVEIGSGCMAVDSWIFSQGNSKYKLQFVFHDIVPPIDKTYQIVASDIHIYVPEVAKDIYKENEFYSPVSDSIDGYEVGDYPETQDFYDFNGLNFEYLEE